MSLSKIVMLCAFLALAQGCELNTKQFQVIGMQCAMKAPSLMEEVIANMDADSDTGLNIICRHRSSVVDVIMCAMDKMEECLPEVKGVMGMIKNKDRWLKAMDMVCDNKETLKDTCMDENLQPFMNCYIGHVTSLANSRVTSDPKDIVCKVIHSEEKCLMDNRGTCSDQYIKVLKDMLETIFPLETCTDGGDKPRVIGNNRQSDLANSLLGSILVGGAPQAQSLQFKTFGKPYNMPYNVIRH